jgi:hypothetical protein
VIVSKNSSNNEQKIEKMNVIENEMREKNTMFAMSQGHQTPITCTFYHLEMTIFVMVISFMTNKLWASISDSTTNSQLIIKF